MVKIEPAEREKILKNVFSSFDPLELKIYSIKFKKKIVILDQIAERFEKGKNYTEKEINEILRTVYSDYVTIRRDLIELRYLDRERDCSEYWRL